MSYSAQQLASSQRKHLIIRNPEMPDTPITVTPRVVPGAPPPAPVSKSQKKKRKGGAKTKEESEAGSHVAVPDTTSAALIEEAPKQSDVKDPNRDCHWIGYPTSARVWRVRVPGNQSVLPYGT